MRPGSSAAVAPFCRQGSHAASAKRMVIRIRMVVLWCGRGNGSRENQPENDCRYSTTDRECRNGGLNVGRRLWPFDGPVVQRWWCLRLPYPPQHESSRAVFGKGSASVEVFARVERFPHHCLF